MERRDVLTTHVGRYDALERAVEEEESETLETQAQVRDVTPRKGFPTTNANTCGSMDRSMDGWMDRSRDARERTTDGRSNDVRARETTIAWIRAERCASVPSEGFGQTSLARHVDGRDLAWTRNASWERTSWTSIRDTLPAKGSNACVVRDVRRVRGRVCNGCFVPRCEDQGVDATKPASCSPRPSTIESGRVFVARRRRACGCCACDESRTWNTKGHVRTTAWERAFVVRGSFDACVVRALVSLRSIRLLSRTGSTAHERILVRFATVSTIPRPPSHFWLPGLT